LNISLIATPHFAKREHQKVKKCPAWSNIFRGLSFKVAVTRFKNILLVEDDADDQAFFTQAIKDIAPAAQWVLAQNGHEAMQLLHSLRPLPDVIFLDLQMPVMDGFAFLRALKGDGRYNKIPVFVFSTTIFRMDECMELGARSCLQKPATDGELRDLLSEIFSRDLV
jgi:CheY-like chemotaxis protein